MRQNMTNQERDKIIPNPNRGHPDECLLDAYILIDSEGKFVWSSSDKEFLRQLSKRFLITALCVVAIIGWCLIEFILWALSLVSISWS